MSTIETIDMAIKQETTRQPSRWLWKWVKRGLKVFVIGIISIILTGVVYQNIATAFDRGNYQPRGQMIAVNGHEMHINCTGAGGNAGSPTVILEAGAYSYSSEWYWVQQQLEPTYRVCSYDRAGNGWSEAVDGKRDGLTLVHELHDLLAAADISAPYVMVGHSLGGVLAPIYASEYPGDVTGLVLVDSAIPLKWADKAQYETYKSQNESAYALMKALTYVGALRLILPPEFHGYGYPADVTAEMTAFKATPQGVDIWDAEVRLAQWDLRQEMDAAVGLGDLPMVTLWASHPEITAAEDRAKLQAIWDMLPAFSNNNEVRIVEGADHGSIIGNEAYAGQVSQAVRDVVEQAVSNQRSAIS